MKKASNPLISVIVPVYNVEKYLSRCLDSIISQTYKNLEIIVVDDGSTDDSRKLCDRYAEKDERIKVFHKKNGGLSDARNYGIERAHGEYISFIDSDDWVETKYIKVLYEGLCDSSCDISMVKHFIDYPNKTIDTGTGNKIKLTPHDCLDKMLYQEDIDVSAWAKLYSKNLFKNISFPKGCLFEDSATTYKLIDKSNAIYLNSMPLYHYVIRKESITNKAFSRKDFDIIKSTSEMAEYVVDKYPDLVAGCNRRLMYAHLSAFRKYAISKNRKDFSEEGAELFYYIRKNRKKVLKDKRIPNRDRWALRLAFSNRSLLLGTLVYEKTRIVL